ncbi:MAG: hypothetical protein QOI81_1137 [Actinomycetota bacterium]|jgi:hypothetical protein|nr:hypothetical protein [Actinomycetota bacterium]
MTASDRSTDENLDDAAPVPRGTLTVLDPAGDEEAPMSLFEQEERPERMILTNIARADAEEFIGALEAEGIGAKLGDPTEGDGVEILIHEPNVAVAQAVLVDFTGDASLADDIEPEGGHDDGMVEVGRFSMLDAQAHIDRLLRAGLDVTLRPPPPDTPAMLAAAVVSVREDDAAAARTILGVTI